MPRRWRGGGGREWSSTFRTIHRSLNYSLYPEIRNRLNDLISVNDGSRLPFVSIRIFLFIFLKDCLKSNAIRKLIEPNLEEILEKSEIYRGRIGFFFDAKFVMIEISMYCIGMSKLFLRYFSVPSFLFFFFYLISNFLIVDIIFKLFDNCFKTFHSILFSN